MTWSLVPMMSSLGRIVDAAASQDERDFAQEVLATRSTTRGGGVINLLDADLDAGKA